MQIQLAAESHVPCFQERVGTSIPGYMIPDRLPWRLRARPSATLHEIQVRSRFSAGANLFRWWYGIRGAGVKRNYFSAQGARSITERMNLIFRFSPRRVI